MAKVIPLKIPEADEILTTAMEYGLDEVLVLGMKDGEPMLFHSSIDDRFRIAGILLEMIALMREPVEK